MPTIFITTTAQAAPSLDLSLVVLRIYLTEPWEGLFDRLEVWRSRDTEEGPYEELTGSWWLPAKLPKDIGPSAVVTGPSYNIVGKKLTFKIDGGTERTVTFTGVDPLSAATLAGQIQTQATGLLESFVDATGRIGIRTVTPGTGASLEILEGDAAALLGLPTEPPDNLAFGLVPRLPLAMGQKTCTFMDVQGETAAFYKTRYRNNMTGAVSEFSVPFTTGQVIGLGPDRMVVGVVDLVDPQGKVLSNREVLLHSDFTGAVIDGKTVAGSSLSKLTDENGHVEFMLVRGTKLTVGIAGTNLARDITVPTDESISIFNLLDPALNGPDVFRVQVPELDYAVRRTL